MPRAGGRRSCSIDGWPRAPDVGIQPAAGPSERVGPDSVAETGVALERARGASVMMIALPATQAYSPRSKRRASDVPVMNCRGYGLGGIAAVSSGSICHHGRYRPMLLAAAVGTPIVAIFGPSLPSATHRFQRVQKSPHRHLCSPCNAMRQPPDDVSESFRIA